MENKDNLEPGKVDMTKINKEDKAILIKMNQTIKKVTDSIEDDYHFNTAIAATMELINDTLDYKTNIMDAGKGTVESKKIFDDVIQTILVMLSPFIPHICDELWSEIGNEGYIYEREWPSYDPKLLKTSEVVIAVQVNGKVRGTVEIERGADKAEVEKLALEVENVQKHIEGKKVVKVIVVPDKIVNIVVK